MELKILSIVILRTVREDQTGFTQGRNSSNNIRRLINMVHLSEQQQIDGFEITPHAQKAFVHVEWSYLFFTLDPFDLGDNYVAAVLTSRHF